ncbi:MAG: hypothetical protein WC595_05325 [Candidatus Nanoarchaeia archaeon]
MAEIKTIKGVDDETWRDFKGLAVKEGLNMGILFKHMLKEYEKSRKTFWDGILGGEKILSEKEAEGMEKRVIKMRKEYGFRT